MSSNCESKYIDDYDDTHYAVMDLEGDLFETMKDFGDVSAPTNTSSTGLVLSDDASAAAPRRTIMQDNWRRVRARAGMRMVGRVWGLLFVSSGGAVDADDN